MPVCWTIVPTVAAALPSVAVSLGDSPDLEYMCYEVRAGTKHARDIGAS